MNSNSKPIKPPSINSIGLSSPEDLNEQYTFEFQSLKNSNSSPIKSRNYIKESQTHETLLKPEVEYSNNDPWEHTRKLSLGGVPKPEDDQHNIFSEKNSEILVDENFMSPTFMINASDISKTPN
mmetsp:Transcript_13079/g.11560  ORF Transcript_13079/g.11560 Transcript_13079/m.11560 type:complete len:124 (+) Transcript_13079:204-575(+)